MLELRVTTAADLADVHAMEQAADTGQWLGETGRRWHEQALADPDQEHLAAGPRGALTGFAVLAGLAGLERGGRVIELRRMVIAPASRGTGQGRALLRAAIARAYDQHGAARVWLDVRPGNQRARSLYQAEGFAPVADVGPAPGDDLLVLEHRRGS